MNSINIIQVDYSNPQQANHLLQLLEEYAQHPMGGSKPLKPFVHDNFISCLQDFPGALSLLACVNDQPAGLLNSFKGFSTFHCKPLINIRDLMVSKTYQGQGISQALLDAIESVAIKTGCCKLTLEVLQGNQVA